MSKMLKVCFVGEPATIDDGGPRREFFSLLLREIFTKSGVFYGWPENVIPMHSVTAVASNKFYVIGKMIATCLIQGGEPPLCFVCAVSEFILFGHIRSPPCIDDIPDENIRVMLSKVSMLLSSIPFRAKVII